MAGHPGSRDEDLVLCAVGDVLIDQVDPDSAFAATGDLLRAADIASANNEGIYSRRPSRPPQSIINLVADPKHSTVLPKAGFAVMTCANNHILDGGYEGLADTLDVLHGYGIATTGAGANLAEARQPAIVERKGHKVAYLAYASTFPMGYEARENMPGLAPIRAHTIYQPAMPNFWNAGAAPVIVTMPHPPDLEALKLDIVNAKARADLVVVSCHQGNSGEPVKIHDYEFEIARTAIDTGADVFLGHHHHCLRGAEIYKGKPIFYGLASFAFYVTSIEKRVAPSMLQRWREGVGAHHIQPRPGYPTFPFPPEYRMVAIARIGFKDGQVASVGLIPCEVQPAGYPQPFAPTSEQGGKILDYIREISAKEGLKTRFEPTGGGQLAGFEAAAVRVAEAG